MRHTRVITKDISKKFAEKTLQESHFCIASLQLEPDLFKYLSFTDLPKENRRKGNKDKKKRSVVYPLPPCTVKAHVLRVKEQHINSYC